MEAGRLDLALCNVAEVHSERAFLARGIPAGKDAATPPEWIELVPAGPVVSAVDGRKFRNTNPQKVVERFNADPNDLPIDYEHASEIKGPKGEEAPAAGWITKLEVREGAIWARVEWTPRGVASLSTREYRYLSPAFMHGKDGEIIEFTSAGLTNRPALRMPALAREWTTAYINDLPDSSFLYIESGGSKDDEGKTEPRSLRHFPYKGPDGSVDLPHLRNALARIPQSSLPADTQARLSAKAEKLLAAASKSTAHTETEMTPELLKALGLPVDATPEQALAAVQKMQADFKASEVALATARAEVAKGPGLDKFVPRADYEQALARAGAAEKLIADEKAAAHKVAVDAEIEAASKAGKVAPTSVEYFRKQCATPEGLAMFRDFLKTSPMVVADSNLDKKPVPGAGDPQITDEQMAIYTRCGITKEQALKSLGK